jgi:hypothetical protein
MLKGRARITAIDQDGRTLQDDVGEGDLWYFPAGIPHSIQGIEGDGCEFLLVFDDGNFSEEETLLLSDWMAHYHRCDRNHHIPCGRPHQPVRDGGRETAACRRAPIFVRRRQRRRAALGSRAHLCPRPTIRDHRSGGRNGCDLFARAG